MRPRLKTELSDKTWARIRDILEERNITQAELLKSCQKLGYHISQPEISKLYGEKIHLTLYHLAAFSEVLGIPTDCLLDEAAVFRRLNVSGPGSGLGLGSGSGSGFIVQPSDEAFRGYLGTYFTIFHSTSMQEEKILRGEMNFSASDSGDICEACFQLDTGEKNRDGSPVLKHYQGQLIISGRMSVAYCILTNEEIGEISLIEFRHRNFFVRQAEARLGLVLTVSAGDKKVPVTQRIFLSRRRIPDENLDEFISFLKLEPQDFLVRKEELEMLADQSEEPEFDSRAFLGACEEDTYAIVNAALVKRGNRKMNRYALAKLLSCFKSGSAGDFLMPLEEQDDFLTYELLEKLGQNE